MDVSGTDCNLLELSNSAGGITEDFSNLNSLEEAFNWDEVSFGDEPEMDYQQNGDETMIRDSDLVDFAKMLDDDDVNEKTLVDPMTLNKQYQQMSSNIDDEEESASLSNAHSSTTVTEEIVTFAEFANNGGLILAALKNAGIPSEAEHVTTFAGVIEQAAVHLPPTLSKSRRKSSILTRNIQDESNSFSGCQLNQVAMESKAVQKRQHKPKTKKNSKVPKMHQMDPEQFPEAKGAVYSKSNRDKKKFELQQAKAAHAEAERKINILQERIEFRDVILTGLVGAPAVAELQRQDQQRFKRIAGE